MADQWTCNTCGTKNNKGQFECAGCNSNEAQSIYAGMLRERLAEVNSYGTTTWESIFRYARAHAKRRNMPFHLVEDAISNALVRMMDNISKYDPTKSSGDFSRWAIRFVRNELLNIARNDLDKNRRISVYLDEEDEEGILVAEGIPDPKTLEPDVDYETEQMREIMISLLGKEVYLECVAAFAETGKRGWAQKAARETRVTAMSISRAKDRAKSLWREWKKERGM